MKSIIATAGILLSTTAPALAGPYANVESNSAYQGNKYLVTVTDIHAGYKGELGERAGYYIQGGPALVGVDGEEVQTEISGKAGLTLDVTERLDIYGEVSFLTEDRSFEEELNVGVKAGATYRF